MSPELAIALVAGYFIILIVVSLITSRGADNQTFFIGNRKSKWYLVAIGMIGASLSGVTFISVPGDVLLKSFTYMQVVLGYLLGYLVIIYVLLPVYYKLNLTSIYTYLGKRYGNISYKTGASFFLLSRVLGASFRLFLVANVLQLVIFEKLSVPFFVTVLITLSLIYVYTFRGGIKTIVWTDTLQTVFMLTAVVATLVVLLSKMDLSLIEGVRKISESGHGRIFDFSGWKSETFFVKHFLSGMFITIVMTGLDQDMMQKNLSCRNLKDAQKNMITYSLAFVPVNLIFMALGALLYIFVQQNGIALPEQPDNLYPLIATQGYLPLSIGIFFILGLIAAAYSSADSALTALTTSFLIDIVGIEKYTEPEIKKRRILTHLAISLLLAVVIIVFKQVQNTNVINSLLKVAGFTYGPLLGLYAFGLYTKRTVNEKAVPFISVVSIVLVIILNKYSEQILFGYKMGFEVLIWNGLFTILGLLFFSGSKKPD
ncbi:MAG: sodium:solute symporter [Bacteroidales bacterium]|nr:sodium:solute symporter [Bacteroidales bacterium]MBN2819035.1 sodium:solute symporter [Bacteroidales bacterium]